MSWDSLSILPRPSLLSAETLLFSQINPNLLLLTGFHEDIIFARYMTKPIARLTQQLT